MENKDIVINAGHLPLYRPIQDENKPPPPLSENHAASSLPVRRTSGSAKTRRNRTDCEDFRGFDRDGDFNRWIRKFVRIQHILTNEKESKKLWKYDVSVQKLNSSLQIMFSSEEEGE